MDFFYNLFDFDLKKDLTICDLNDEFFCIFLLNLFHKYNRSIIIVCNSIFEAHNLYDSLQNYFEDVLLFPMDDFITSEALAISPDLMLERLNTLKSLICDDQKIVVTNLMGYLRFLPSNNVFKSRSFTLKKNDIINPKSLVDKLISSGYNRSTLVTKTGEFSVRGFVIDFFGLGDSFPTRIEFFDDEIESIRSFDSQSQKSIKNIDSVTIYPYSEFLTLTNSIDSEHYGKQKYLQLYGDVVNIEDYLNNPLTVFRDYNQLLIEFSKISNEVEQFRLEKDINFSLNYMFQFDSCMAHYPLFYYSINNVFEKSIHSIIHFNILEVKSFNEDIDAIKRFIFSSLNNNKTIIICLKRYQLDSLNKHLNLNATYSDFNNIILNTINLVDFDMNEGFIFNNYIFLTAKELFRKKDSVKNYKSNFKYTTPLKDVNSIDIGDYVVHSAHGIGVYNGIKTLSSNSISKDYLEILYLNSDKVYVPVEKIDSIFKYSSKDGVVPKINSLNSKDWEKTKRRVQLKVREMADKLLKIYAERKAKKGFSFSKDCDLSLEFEKDIPFELTVDQKKAIQEIKSDMESETPMDRLLCGDVGFGKTEVAFVASFKAILDSKQVILLCPTTILSKQHFDNAINRFKNYPVNIELLNRFTSKKDVERIINGLKSGTVDMIIGTHRVLSDDVCMHDLGLLIIDEEQRFGVRHKEKIKEYKVNVDVLTLTATPIPRTLQMSLVGIRSLSLIETPPINRFPVQTYVLEENNQILKDSIYKELSRNGQVFILYNHVQTIAEYADKIGRLIPEAKIGIAHGQMNKYDLEDTLYQFVDNKFDILVCSTIIETGIDIPNVNTLIIIDADRFGLSQLYQIRGRVGRSDKFAYAYLMYPPYKQLTDTAIKRLNVIKKFTELGSGFSIASHDLSIRGAGDLLGSEQAGFIDSVGVDLYIKMLNDEIKNVNNSSSVYESEGYEENNKPLLNVTTHIDDNYVFEDDLKIEIHRLINTIEDQKSFNAVKSEMEDRFGVVSEDLLIYMYEEWFEKLAFKLNISNVHQSKNCIELLLPHEVLDFISIDDLFVESYNISRYFRFISRNNKVVINLDILHLDKHPIYYLVQLFNFILIKKNKAID